MFIKKVVKKPDCDLEKTKSAFDITIKDSVDLDYLQEIDPDTLDGSFGFDASLTSSAWALTVDPYLGSTFGDLSNKLTGQERIDFITSSLKFLLVEFWIDS